jgi:hypothetical protein
MRALWLIDIEEVIMESTENVHDPSRHLNHTKYTRQSFNSFEPKIIYNPLGVDMIVLDAPMSDNG